MIIIEIYEIKELTEALKKTTGAKNTLYNLHNLIDTLGKCTYIQILNYLKDYTREFAINNMLCPHCEKELHIETWDENRGDCRGTPATERMAEWVCDECGFRE